MERHVPASERGTMKLVSLKSDYAFRMLFSHENVRRQFLGDVLGIPSGEIRHTTLASPNLWVRYKKQKQGILDVLMELEDGTKANVEMQVRRLKHWTKRQLFYLAKMYTDDLKSGENYDKLRKCVSIAVLDFNLTDSPKYHNVYRMRNEWGEGMSDVLEAHVIELRKELQGTDAVDDWIRLFNAKKEEDLSMIKTMSVGMIEAIEALRQMSLSKAMRYRHEMNLKLRRDRKAEDDYVRECGRSEGKAEGKAEYILLLLDNRRDAPEDEASGSMEEIRQIIMAQKDIDVLNMWFEAAIKAKDLKDFKEKCGI